MHPLTRRELLRRCSLGFGGIALSSLLSTPAFGAETSGKRPLKAKAKNVIFCYMSGGVSHVDSFDPKAALAKLHGKPMPARDELLLSARWNECRRAVDHCRDAPSLPMSAPALDSPQQFGLFAAAPSAAQEALAAIDPDELSPKQALEALYRLKALL